MQVCHTNCATAGFYHKLEVCWHGGSLVQHVDHVPITERTSNKVPADLWISCIESTSGGGGVEFINEQATSLVHGNRRVRMSPNLLSKLSWAPRKSASCCLYTYITSMCMLSGEGWDGLGGKNGFFWNSWKFKSQTRWHYLSSYSAVSFFHHIFSLFSCWELIVNIGNNRTYPLLHLATFFPDVFYISLSKSSAAMT